MNRGPARHRAPLRRRARAALIGGVVRAGGFVPTAATAALLRTASRIGIDRRFADVVDANVDAVLPCVRERAPAVAARLEQRRAFRRELADFVALQTSQWIRLARGAAPGEARGRWVDDLVRVDPSIEHLERALAGDRGAIVVTAHIGNWELLCARLRRLGHHGAVVGRIRQNDPSHAWLARMRTAYGIETLAQDAPARAMLAVLRSGGVLGLLTDLRARRVDARPVPFFGADVPTMTAAAAFARAARAPIVPMRCTRATDGAFVLRAEAPLALDPGLPRHDAALALLREQNRTFERWIIETPEQWAWHQERFGPRAR